MLPLDHIIPAFDHITRNVKDNSVQTFIDYVNSTWMKNSIWSVNELSVFKQTVHKTTIWKGGTIASTIVLIAAAFPFICSQKQNCFTRKRGTSVSRWQCCQRADCSGTHDGAMQMSMMNWRSAGRNTRLASWERRSFFDVRNCNYLSVKLPTPTQTDEQSQTINTSRYFKHLLMCAFYIFYCHLFSQAQTIDHWKL